MKCSRSGIDERCALSLFISTPVDCALGAHPGALVDEVLGTMPILINWPEERSARPLPVVDAVAAWTLDLRRPQSPKCPYGHRVDISPAKWTSSKKTYNYCRFPVKVAENSGIPR